MNKWQHWSCETDENNIAWVIIDRHGEKTNTLSREVVAEFAEVVEYLESSKPSGVVLSSGKSSGFIFGADINEFLALKEEADAYDLIHTTQSLLDRWESLPVPTVAIISGMCLGGGFEVALATRYRVANTDTGTRFGLPEVKLGIQPGWGGTVRLPRLIGALQAMPLLLSGKMLDPKRAKRLGFVDKAVPGRHCRAAALDLIAKKPAQHRPGWFARVSSSFPPLRRLLASKISKKLSAQGVIREHYPAPYAMVNNWAKVGLSQEAYELEARSIAQLMMTPTAKQLVRVFFMQSQLKATAKGDGFAGKHIHVIGAGTMGGDIAAWCALQGFYVTLQDQTAQRIAPAIECANKLYLKKLRNPAKARMVIDRLVPDVAGDGIAKADLIIEAIFENLDAKQAVFCDIEQRAKPGAIFATNTSSIPLANIATALHDPSRLVGIHFFNPVSQMQLVEVVYDEGTSDQVMQQAAAFVKQIKRLPLPVKSHPGFLVNRVLMPYLLESIALFEEGVDIKTIDLAAKAYGMPMGPIRLADTVGLDVCLMVARNLLSVYGGSVPSVLERLVEQGNLGVKTKSGFYNYRGKSTQVAVTPEKSIKISKQDIADRLIYRQLNEAVAVLRECIVASPDLLDAGMIYGTGFAPFRGGPLQYARDVGISDLLDRFGELTQQYGERFKPDEGWSQLSVVPAETSKA